MSDLLDGYGAGGRRPGASDQENERIRQRAYEALQERAFDLAGKAIERGDVSLAELVENLRIYQAELILQNEELQQNEQRAESSAQRFQALFEHAPLAVFVVSRRGLVSDANVAAQHLLGLSSHRLCNTFFLRLFNRPSQGSVLEGLSRCMAEGDSAVVDVSFLPTDGDERIGTLHITALPAGNPEHSDLVCVLVDTTEVIRQQRRLGQMNQRLAASEARFRTLVENGSDIVATLDTEARFVYVSPSWTRVLGHPAEQVHGRNCGDYILIEDRQRFADYLRCLFEGEPDPAIEFRIPRADGAVCWIAARARLAAGAGGAPVVIATWRDVTERRRAEEESLLNQMRLQELLDLAQRAAEMSESEVFGEALAKAVRLTRSQLGYLRVLRDDCPGVQLFEWPAAGSAAVLEETAARSGQDDGEVRSEGIGPDGSRVGAVEEFETSSVPGAVRQVTVPVMEGEQVRMVVAVGNKPVPYDEADVRLLHLLAGDVLRIVERGRAQEKLRLSARVFESSAEGVVMIDADFRIVAVNRAFSEITGYEEVELLGLAPEALKSDCHDDDFYRSIWSSLQQNGVWKGELLNRRKNGEIYPAWLTVSAVHDDLGKLTHYVAVFGDITAIKQSEEKLDFLAHHDPLTSLPNRLRFNARLESALGRARRNQNKVAVLFLDLDRFKGVNDSLGHPVGDALLQGVAREMRAVLRGEDTLARIGGDEFVVLLEDVIGVGDVIRVVQRLMNVFGTPIGAGSHELYVTVSVGISVFPDDGTLVYELLRNADAAMYLAKTEGRNTYRFYNPQITVHALERLRLETELRKALRDAGLSLHFQAQIELGSGKLLGAEVLARWMHKELGAISPYRFIPVAEETGLIAAVGAFVLNDACKQLRRWRDSGFELPGIAVNLSVAQLERQDVAAQVQDALQACRLSGSDLELEITESVIMRHTDQAIDTLNRLRTLGVRLAIDDFGAGFSSLNYLKRLPIQKLKIDQSFVSNIGTETNDEAIVRAVLALSANLNLRVIAEGVETELQAQFLRDAGCTEAQGYLFSQPLPADEFAEKYRSWPLASP